MCCYDCGQCVTKQGSYYVCADCGPRWLFTMNRPCADMLLVSYDHPNKVLLIKRADTGDWCTPGGFVEPKEIPRNAAVREMAEEIGYDLNKTTWHDAFQSSGISWPVYIGTYLDDHGDHANQIEMYWMHPPTTYVNKGRVCGSEVADISWFKITALPPTTRPFVREAIADLFHPGR